jgi:hypothetical protein
VRRIWVSADGYLYARPDTEAMSAGKLTPAAKKYARAVPARITTVSIARLTTHDHWRLTQSGCQFLGFDSLDAIYFRSWGVV